MTRRMGMHNGFTLVAAAALLAIGGLSPDKAAGHDAVSQGAPRAAAAVPEADRRAILAMAGTFKVRFDFREKVAFVPGYTPLAPKLSSGHEVVRVIADTGDHIVLQHILVAQDPAKADAEPVVIKHWRQDWTWQPRTVLSYKAASTWALDPVAPADAAGAWSQTVWQTDDSPRYGAIGRWTHDKGVDVWTSTATLRPLARRDAVRKPVYDRYVGINRHALTPTGWVHEQDNAKLAMQDGRLITIVDETVVNSYDRFAGFNAAAADEYWRKTEGYWREVRSAWDSSLAGGKPLTVTEVADVGSITGERLMTWADEIATARSNEKDAGNRARALIGGLPPTKLAAR